jgi:integrase
MERCPSGLRSTLGKRVYGQTYRGFESLPLRQLPLNAYLQLRESPLNMDFSSHVLACSLIVCHHESKYLDYGLDYVGRTAKTLTEQQALKITAGTRLVKDGVYIRAADKSWMARPTIEGKRTWIKLGTAKGLGSISLSRAIRISAGRVAEHINSRKDKPAKTAKGLAMSFETAAEKYIEVRAAGWRNDKSQKQWQTSLEKYVFPKMGSIPVGDITTTDVLEVLTPIWADQNETANRIRQRIFRIIAYTRSVAEEPGFNPALLMGHLDNILPSRKQVRESKPVTHMAAVPWREFPGIYQQLQNRKGMTHRLMMFQALCASRPGETRKAQWRDIDFEHAIWRIRAGTEKVKQGQVIPLSTQAVEILEAIRGDRDLAQTDYIFSVTQGKPINENAPSVAIGKMGLRDVITAHGSRSSFRDWGAANGYSEDMLERALAHTAGAVKRAYQRDQLVEERRPLMQVWADFATGDQSNG